MKKRITKHVSSVIIYYKFVGGVVELLFGLGFLFLSNTITQIYATYRLRELLDDPHDLLISIIQKIAPVLIQYHTYFMITMIVFGLVKIIGAIALFYDKDWGLDLFILFFFLMLPLDLYTLFSRPTYLKTMYFLVNSLITLYLVEFKPHLHLLKYVKYFKKKK